jgi:hypothetical protein
MQAGSCACLSRYFPWRKLCCLSQFDDAARTKEFGDWQVMENPSRLVNAKKVYAKLNEPTLFANERK